MELGFVFYLSLFQVLVEHEDIVMCAAVTESNRFVLSGSKDKRLLVWGLSTGAVERQLIGHTGHVTCVKVTRDSSTAISGEKPLCVLYSVQIKNETRQNKDISFIYPYYMFLFFILFFISAKLTYNDAKYWTWT